MDITDLNKEIRRFLLKHWTAREIKDHLHNPEYFFDQIVAPHMDYLRRQGEEAPRVRTQRLPTGELKVVLNG